MKSQSLKPLSEIGLRLQEGLNIFGLLTTGQKTLAKDRKLPVLLLLSLV